MKTIFGLLRHVRKADAFSPTAFVARAIIIALLFGGSELLGLRQYTTFLSGTSANINVSWQTAATLGLIHLLLYVAFILFVPVSLITAGLLIAWNRCTRRFGGQNQDATAQCKPNPQLHAQPGFISSDRSMPG